MQNLVFEFAYQEFLERLGFDIKIDELVNVGLDNDGTIIFQCYGETNSSEFFPEYRLKTGYIDNEEILELLEDDYEYINLSDDEYAYELAYIGTELANEKVIVHVTKTYIEE